MGSMLSLTEKYYYADNVNGYTSDDYEDDLLEEQYENEIREKHKIFNERYNQNEKALPYPEDRYEWLRKLNTGFYGRVDLVRDKNTGQDVAMKTLSKEFVIRAKAVSKTKNERRILASLDHPFIVKMIESYKDSEHLYLLMEYCDGYDMYEYLVQANKLPEDQILFFGAQVFMALDFMHSLGLIYRDLKPENVMLSSDGYVKLTDMGFAKKVVGRTSSFNCTLEYCAPELMKQGLRDTKTHCYGYNKSVDWWSFGVMLYDMFFGKTPFGIKSVALQYYDKTLQFPDSISQDLKHLLINLLQYHVPKRLGCGIQGSDEIKSHQFFKSMDWKRLYFKKIQAPYVPNSEKDLASGSQSGSECEDGSSGKNGSEKDCDVENMKEILDQEFEDF